jgi:hypothetical protein
LGTYGDGVFVKNREAATWTSFNAGLSDLNVTGVTSSAGKIFAGTDGSGVFVTDANTDAWTATSPIVIPHYNAVPGLNPNHIQYIAAVKDYVLASYKGGIVATFNAGDTWGPGGNQFHLPSYSNYHKIAFVTSRIFVTTETNNPQANNIAELAFIDSVLIVNEQTVASPIGGTNSIHDVTSNIKWEISSSESWVSLNADSGAFSTNVVLQIAANTGTPRTATITLTGGSLVETIVVNQDGTVGITENNMEVISLYPNPNNGNFTINFNGNTDVQKVSILDVTGKQISTIPVLNSRVIEVSENLSPGVYFVQLQSASNNTVKRVIIE